MRVTIDENKCIGSGACVLKAPDVFDQDEDGIVVLLGQPANDKHVQEAVSAALACPANVIEVESA
jgi:ferredoxin